MKFDLNIVVEITEPEDLYNKIIHKGQKIHYVCKNCGKDVCIGFYKRNIKNYEKMYCWNCGSSISRKLSQKETNEKISNSLKKFFKDPDNKETRTLKIKTTKKEKYGDENFTNREKAKTTYKEKTGFDNPSQNPEVKLSKSKTFNDHYGKDFYFQTETFKKYMDEYKLNHPEFKENKILKDLDRNGGIFYVQTEEFKSKSRKKKKEKYGYEFYTNRDLAKSTYKERTGYETPFENPEVLEECFNSVFEKYGCKVYTQSDDYKKNKENIINKIKETNNFKFGVDWFSKSDYFKEYFSLLFSLYPEKFLSHNRFIYGNLSFDSIPEFCVYIYCIYNNIPIIRNYTQYFKYIDIRGKIHRVYPDFIINGKFVEIKGGHFFKEDGTMYLPYRDPEWDDEEYEYRSSVYESKRQCLLNNGVQILKDTDPWVQNCITYVNTIVNIDSFVKSNPNNLCYGYTPFNCNRSKEYQDPIGLGKTPFDI